MKTITEKMGDNRKPITPGNINQIGDLMNYHICKSFNSFEVQYMINKIAKNMATSIDGNEKLTKKEIEGLFDFMALVN